MHVFSVPDTKITRVTVSQACKVAEVLVFLFHAFLDWVRLDPEYVSERLSCQDRRNGGTLANGNMHLTTQVMWLFGLRVHLVLLQALP